MLTSVPLHTTKTGMTPVRRAPRSLKQEYQEFILQRLEEYKNTVPRAELLKIGDEAVRELQASAQDQYLLTEVLLLEHVGGPSGSSRATSLSSLAPRRWAKRSISPLMTPKCSCWIRTWARSRRRRAAR